MGKTTVHRIHRETGYQLAGYMHGIHWANRRAAESNFNGGAFCKRLNAFLECDDEYSEK